MTDGHSGRARPGEEPARSALTSTLLRTLWPLAAVTGLLGLAALAAAHSSIGFERIEPPSDVLPTLRQPSEPPVDGRVTAPGTGPTLPEWIPMVAALLCGAVVLVVLGVLIWTLGRDLLRRRKGLARGTGRRSVRSATETAQEVVAALDAGLVDLSDGDADPRKAVIACWVRLEQAAAAAGVERRPGDTPTELVTRLLGAGRPVSADVLAAFAEVYREARYATHTVDERMRAQARSALQRLRTELTTPSGSAGTAGGERSTRSGAEGRLG